MHATTLHRADKGKIDRSAMAGTVSDFTLALLVPDRPTEREIKRARAMLRADWGWKVSVIASETARRQISDRSADQPDVVWHDSAEFAGRRGDLERAGIKAAISLAEWPSAADLPDLGARHGTWMIVECVWRQYGGAGSLERAVGEGRSHLEIAITRPAGQGHELRVIIRSGRVPRRPWDSIEKLQRRLDERLPSMLREASECFAECDQSASTLPCCPPGKILPWFANWRQRATDVRYFVHLLGSTWSLVHRSRATKILCLHNPCPDILDETLKTLARCARFLRYSEVEEELRAGRVPPPGFVVTFDDGYKQNMALLDVLDKYGCMAMFFVNTGAVDSATPLWFMNLDKSPSERKPHLKTLGYRDFLETIEKEGLTHMSRSQGRFGLQSREIRTLIRRGHEIGVHTHNHPFLILLQDNEIQYEITECVKRLRDITDNETLPLRFAYPDGAYDGRVVAALEGLEASSAVTLGATPVNAAVHPLTMPRYSLSDSDYPGVAFLKQTAVFWNIKRLLTEVFH